MGKARKPILYNHTFVCTQNRQFWLLLCIRRNEWAGSQDRPIPTQNPSRRSIPGTFCLGVGGLRRERKPEAPGKPGEGYEPKIPKRMSRGRRHRPTGTRAVLLCPAMFGSIPTHRVNAVELVWGAE